MMLIHKSQRLTDGNYKLIYTYNTWSTCSKTINSLDFVTKLFTFQTSNRTMNRMVTHTPL